MPPVVPDLAGPVKAREGCQPIGEVLEALLQFTGARAGWVGVVGPDAALTFPIRRGLVPETWLTLQQGRDSAWGVAFRDGPTLLNDLDGQARLGQPPLENLLSCALERDGKTLGQVVLANKPAGFTSHDAAVLQGMAHLIGNQLARSVQSPAALDPLSSGVLDTLDEGVVILDEGGRLLFCNAVWLEWTGFSREEIIGGMPPFPFWVSHRMLPLLTAPVGVALAEDEAAELVPFRRRDDTIFWCRLRMSVVEDGNSRRLVAAIHPLPTKIAASPLPNLAGLAEALPFAVALTDLAGKVLWANALFVVQMGAGRAVEGHALADYVSGTDYDGPAPTRYPADAEACLTWLACRNRCPSGSERLIGAIRVVVGSVAEPLFLYGFSGDWAALGLAEVADAPGGDSPAVVPLPESLALRLAPHREVQYWDRRWEQLTGLPAADLAGVASEVLLDWLLPRQQDRDRVADLLHQPAPTGAQFPCELLTPSGTQEVLSTWIPVTGDEGRHWLLLVDRVHRLSGSAGSFSASPAFLRGLHQLLNHLLLGPLAAAERGLGLPGLGPDAAETFAQIVEGCERFSTLLDPLHDLAAPPPRELSPVSLAALVRELAEEQADVDYERVLDFANDPLLVRANPRLLMTVLRQLLRNAEQALPTVGTRRITLRVFVQPGEVGCSITDSGEGLPDGDWTALLAPFASTKGAFAHDATHAALDAAGLGLTLCRHLLEAQGGRLELRSLTGGGTSAQFFLPRVQVELPEPSPFRVSDDDFERHGPDGLRGPHTLGAGEARKPSAASARL